MNKKIFIIALLVQTIAAFSVKAASYTYLGLVGDATVAGWVSQGVPMVQSTSNNNIFTYSGYLTTGDLKIQTSNVVGDWCDGDWIMPTDNGQSITNAAHIVSSGCAIDNKWKIEAADQGIYNITINVENMTISFVKVSYYTNLYLVGDATPGGWVLNNATGLTVDAGNPALFTWTGNLVAGNFKIATNLTFAGNHTWIHPLNNGQALNETGAAYILSGNTDYQWNIGASDEGAYTVTINLAGVNPAVQIVKTGPLPLDLLSFSAKLDKALASKATLNWLTTNEVNTSLFSVERSIDAKSFETIGSIPAKNIAGTHQYTFEDKNVLKGIAYYRLKQIDINGKYVFSDIASVNNNSGLQLSVYPNPSTEHITFNYISKNAEVSVFNINGQKVISTKLASDNTLNVKTLASGYYTIVVNDGVSKNFVRFVKQ